jgi:mitogen-activated protein kinase kinase kinase
VAVKQITQTKLVDNLINEIKLLQKLQNPYIVKYYGCKQDETHLNIYLEYMSGRVLLSHILQGGSIAERLK